MYVFKIEKNVPIPADKSWHSRLRTKYHTEKMKVGDSFIYDGSITGAYSLILQSRYHLGHEYLRRTSKNGQRIWRIK